MSQKNPRKDTAMPTVMLPLAMNRVQHQFCGGRKDPTYASVCALDKAGDDETKYKKPKIDQLLSSSSFGVRILEIRRGKGSLANLLLCDKFCHEGPSRRVQ